MKLDKLTQKAQEALQAAQTRALRFGHGGVDGEHLLLVLLEQRDGLLPLVLERMGVGMEGFAKEVERSLEKRPRVSGRAAEIYVTRRLQEIIIRAEEETRNLKDEYISVEHLALALIDERITTGAGRFCERFGVTREGFLAALARIRGSQRVTLPPPLPRGLLQCFGEVWYGPCGASEGG